jgi:hypothetical protein
LFFAPLTARLILLNFQILRPILLLIVPNASLSATELDPVVAHGVVGLVSIMDTYLAGV